MHGKDKRGEFKRERKPRTEKTKVLKNFTDIANYLRNPIKNTLIA